MKNPSFLLVNGTGVWYTEKERSLGFVGGVCQLQRRFQFGLILVFGVQLVVQTINHLIDMIAELGKLHSVPELHLLLQIPLCDRPKFLIHKAKVFHHQFVQKFCNCEGQ